MKLESERLYFREWKISDIKSMVSGLNDFSTAKNLTVPYPYTEQNAIEFINKHLSNTETDFYFAICLKETDEVIGGTNISIDKDSNSNKGGIWLNKKFTGKGYGTEAFTLRAKFAFEELKLDVLNNGFFYFNEASKNMQLKVGYKIVGEKKNYSAALGIEVKEIVTRLTKDDFYSKLKDRV